MVSARLLVSGLLILFLCTPIPVLAHSSITIGVFPRNNYDETIRMFLPMSKYLSKKLGIKVRVTTAKNFSQFWDNVVKNKYDLVHLNQYQYLAAHQQSGYQILLMNEEFGQATMHATILTRKDSGIKTLADLKGKNIIFGGNDTAMVSYLIPRHMLQDANIQDHEYTTTFARNPPNALMAVYLKRADACGVGDTVLKFNDIQQQINADEFRILAESLPIPQLAWAASPKLAAPMRTQIVQILVKLKDTNKGRFILSHARLTGLKKATHTDYISLEKYTQGRK